MLRRIALHYSDRFVSKWLILVIDLLMVFGLFLFAYVIRFNFNMEVARQSFYLVQMPYVLLVFFSAFLIFQSYSGIIRHTTVKDSIKIFFALTIAALSMVAVTLYVQRHYINHPLNIPFSVILVHYLLCAFVLVNIRFMIKLIYYHLVTGRKEYQNVLIYGAGTLGIVTKHALDQSIDSNYRVVGFIDDNPSKQRKKIEGIQVYSPLYVFRSKFIEKTQIKVVILAIQELSLVQKQAIANKCLNYNLEVKIVPPVEKWLHGELSVNRIASIKIEDLLGREAIVLDKDNIIRGIANKKILITGAAGSIGSEIVRQVMQYKPAQLILYDQAETPMNDLFLEIQSMQTNIPVSCIIGDVTNKKKLQQLFASMCPDVVFHAAAYKHVPMMEDNPYEAIRVNVGGTRILSDLSVDFNVSRFVMISTDKAVNPTNVMGASKRIAEIYTHSLNKIKGKTRFIITRFGNVLGSNGSVVPLFKKQIEAGGPVTVTHPAITRFFMTISEACQLVLEAAFMGKEGEIYVFDMGESVNIADLAKKMIKLSGYVLNKDIEIVYTGLRQGEKLHEELLANKEKTKPTHHPKIMIGQVNDYDCHQAIAQIIQLIDSLDEMSEMQLVDAMKRIVPEFISNNSVYSILDKKTQLV